MLYSLVSEVKIEKGATCCTGWRLFQYGDFKNIVTHSLLTDLIALHAKDQSVTLRYIVELVEDLSADLRPIQTWAVGSQICTVAEWKKAIAREVKRRQLIEALGAAPDHAFHFVELYAATKRAEIRFNGCVVMDDPETGKREHVTISDFTRLCRLADGALKTEFGTQAVNDGAEEFIRRARRNRRPMIIAPVRYSPTATFDWRALAKATCAGDPDYAAALMQHFIWQVKRKAADIPVTDHLMLIFGGAQNVGKSTFAKLLFSPVAELMRSASFAQLTDVRIIELWSASVIFMDEMSFASKADADEVKTVITADVVDRRPMRANTMEPIRQMGTLIGTTNKPLEMLIRDTTGNRRFGYLDYIATPDRSVINSADYVAAWQSVDETKASPIVGVMDVLHEHQADSRVLSTVEQWIESFDARDADALDAAAGAGASPALRRDYLFERFAGWQDSAQIAPRDRLDLAGFGHELKRLSAMTAAPTFSFKKTKFYNGYVFDRSTLGEIDPTGPRARVLSIVRGDKK